VDSRTTLIDGIISDFVSPPDDPVGRARALNLMRLWHVGIEHHDFDLLESLMHPDVVIELPFNESGRTEVGYYRVYDGIPACLEFWRAAAKFEGEMRPFENMDLTVSPDGSRLFLEARGDVTMQSGTLYRNRYVLRLDIMDGKVRRYREYYNPITSAHAFGRPIAGQFLIENL
jgi:ketosteroid isomerase-like protein